MSKLIKAGNSMHNDTGNSPIKTGEFLAGQKECISSVEKKWHNPTLPADRQPANSTFL
jgi:hypothetical protein